jgi:hypothetical protein
LLLAAASALTMALNFLIAPLLFAILDGTSRTAQPALDDGPRVPVGINIALVATIAVIYAELGLARWCSSCSTSLPSRTWRSSW